MYIYHALINALSAHMIHINLNMIFHTHVEHSPTKTIYIKYYNKKILFKFYRKPAVSVSNQILLLVFNESCICIWFIKVLENYLLRKET